jgi:hypothetical protein
MARKLNVHIKTRWENKPIRPIVNNTHAPAYKTAKDLNKKLNSLINLRTPTPQKMRKKRQKNLK